MIVNTTFRMPGGLATHLGRTDTNEEVRVRDDLSLGCQIDVVEALRDFSAAGRAYGANKASLIHFSLSPQIALLPEQETAMIDKLRAVYGMSPDHPVIVVEHHKPGSTDRPSHYHCVFPRVDIHNGGKQVSDSFYKIKNERLSLELEFDFRHPLTPGPNLPAVFKVLEKARPDMASALSSLQRPARNNDRTTVSEKDQAQKHSVSLPDFDRRVLDSCLEGSGLKLDSTKLQRAGLKLARGDKSVMIVDLQTGLSQSLARVMTRESKHRGSPLKIRNADIEKMLAGQQLPALDHAGDVAHAADMSASGKNRPTKNDDDERQAELNARRDRTIKNDLAVIRERVRHENDRRFRIAQQDRRRSRFWHRHRKMAGLTVGAIGLAAGGIPAGLIALFIARGVIAAHKIGVETTPMARLDIKAETSAYFSRVRAASNFDLNSIPKLARPAAGAIYQAVSIGQEPNRQVVEALERVAPGLSDKLIGFAQYGRSLKIHQIMSSMFDSDDPKSQAALNAFVADKSMATLPQPDGNDDPDDTGRTVGKRTPTHWPNGTRKKGIPPPAKNKGRGGRE